MALVCERIADGEGLSKICQDSDMPSRSSVMDWVHADQSFEQMYRMALLMRAEQYADELVPLADSALGRSGEDVAAVKTMVNTRQWVASRLLPKVYGEHVCEMQASTENVDAPLAVLMQKLTGGDSGQH